MTRKITGILEKIYHASKEMKIFAREEACWRLRKRHASKRLFDAVDELALTDDTKRKDD